MFIPQIKREIDKKFFIKNNNYHVLKIYNNGFRYYNINFAYNEIKLYYFILITFKL